MGVLRDIVDALRGRGPEPEPEPQAVVEHDRADLAYGEREPERRPGTDRDRRFGKDPDRVRVERPGPG